MCVARVLLLTNVTIPTRPERQAELLLLTARHYLFVLLSGVFEMFNSFETEDIS